MEADTGSAFNFDGHWREYAPIAITNLILIVATLGIYRFWATTRTRQYLWSHTSFIDERLEWTGTGRELFVGFLMVLLLFSIPVFFVQFGVEILAFKGQAMIASVVGVVAFLVILYLTGVARLRALRYRLSRTSWRGIRGGSADRGWNYGVSYCWRNAISALTLYLNTPWAMMTLWNSRWNRMSLGSEPFFANGRARNIFKSFLLFYLTPILFIILVIATLGTTGGYLGPVRVMSNFPPFLRIIAFIVVVVCVYSLVGIIALVYYGAFLREAFGGMRWAGLEFQFEATLDEFLPLIFGDIALVVLTLGIGTSFLPYRHWKFFITHMQAKGDISLADLSQSTLKVPGQGEGLLDALDIGAF